MASRRTVHFDGSVESWDLDTNLYVRTDASGAQVESRALTSDEVSRLDPNAQKLKELQDVVDQLILDALMGAMF